MPDDLYDQDILIWSEHQAGLLRRLAAGERLNETLDWANVIEEIESVGRSELYACESLLRQAMLHLMKMRSEPDSPALNHWRGETIAFLNDAQKRFTPSMRQRLVLQDTYRVITRQLGPHPAVPELCPFQLDDLLDPDAEPIALLAALDAKEASC